ncbi:hypothetical protein D9758_012015 [Tetrapyrgos nigripes]|uniref:F-box domain-containing protein n=1 Tax=Tetrapyrgos nigripes TaxID=182062 RepID=A0A8H5CPD6_9AGAR|nr:hypothetical protein D9758_012015 [Tetrapyrgos nigripes]
MDSSTAPSGLTHEEILRSIADGTRDIQRMNAQISRLWSALDFIVQKRDNHLQHVSSLRRSITSPIPTETLQKIFMYCIEEFPVISGSEGMAAPLVLTHVCRRWQYICLDTPGLWSSMHVVVPNPGTFAVAKKATMVLNVLRAFLERSRDLPLDISVYFRHIRSWDVIPEGTQDQRAFHVILDVFRYIVNHSRRWKYVKILVPSSYFVQATSLMTSEDLPCLERAIICTSQSLGALSGAPQLRQLSLLFDDDQSLTGPTSRWGPSSDTWVQLKVLKLRASSSFYTADILSVLGSCPNLEQCMLDINELYDEHRFMMPVTPQICILPHVEALHVATANIKLNINVSLTPDFGVTAQIVDLLAQHCGSLQNLNLIHEGYDEDSYFMDDDLLQAFTTPPPEHGMLCPQLQELVFNDRGALSDQVFSDFIVARVTSRRTFAKPLERVIVNTSRSEFASRFSPENLPLEEVRVIKDSYYNALVLGHYIPKSREITIDTSDYY